MHEKYKMLSRRWDSATPELLDAAEMQNFAAHFSIPPIAGYYDHLGRFRHADSQDTDVSCRVPISTFWHFTITIHQRCRRTDGRHARSTSIILSSVSITHLNWTKLENIECAVLFSSVQIGWIEIRWDKRCERSSCAIWTVVEGVDLHGMYVNYEQDCPK